MQESALATRRRVLGEEHPATLTSMNNLAISLWHAGEHPAAARQMRAAAEGLARALGADHPNTRAASKAADTMQQASSRKPIPL